MLLATITHSKSFYYRLRFHHHSVAPTFTLFSIVFVFRSSSYKPLLRLRYREEEDPNMASKRRASSSETSASTSKSRRVPRSFQKGSAVDRFKAVLLVREEWKKKSDAETVKRSTHSQFLSHVLSVFSGDRTCSAWPAVRGYLELYLDTGRLDLFSESGVKDIIGINAEAKNYRIITVIDDYDNNGDKRVCEMVLWLMSRQASFSMYSLFNTFFTYVASIVHTTPRGDPDIWRTKAATNFERVLFLALLSEIYASSGRGRKRMGDASSGMSSGMSSSDGVRREGRERESAPQIVEGRVINKFDTSKSPQRVGFLIQFVCRSWDDFARSMDFENVEEMVQPYIFYDTQRYRFEELSRKEMGFMVESSAREFKPNQQTTIVSNETFAGVSEYPGSVDSHLRMLALELLNDIRRLVLTNEMYSVVDQMDLRSKLKGFRRAQTEDIASRFKAFDETMVATIRSARRASLGLPEAEEIVDMRSSGANDGAGQADTFGRDGDVEWVSEDIMDSICNEKVPQQVYKRKMEAKQAVGKLREKTSMDAAIEAVSKQLETVSMMLCCSFRDFLLNVDDCESPPAAHPFGNTQLVLIDPPFNIRRERSKINSAHDNLFPEDFDRTVNTIDELLRPGGHAIIFCSSQQFPEWERTFNTYSARQSVGSSDANVGNGKTFNVDPVPMYFINKRNCHKSFPGRASCCLQSNVDTAIHVKKNGLSFSEERKMVNYKAFNYVQSSYSALKNSMDNVPRLAPHEGLLWPRDRDSNSGRQGLVRPEQKALPLLQELVSRFSQPGDLVVDFFAGSFSTAVACFSVPQHRIFVGCEVEEDCYQLAKKHVVNTFAETMSDPNFATNLVLPQDVLECSAVLASYSKKNHEQGGNWKAPSGFPQYQVFPSHVFQYFSQKVESMQFYEQYFGAELDRWPAMLQRQFNQVDTSLLLQVEEAVYRVMVMPSLIKHEKAGKGVFAGKSFEKGDIVCYYYGTLVYHYLGNRKSQTTYYGGLDVMGVNVERFRRYSMQVMTTGNAFNNVGSSTDGKVCVYVVPPPFCVAGFINDWSYDKDDADYEKYKSGKGRLANVRSANVVVYQEPHPVKSVEHLKKTGFIVVCAKKAIRRGEELYADYARNELVL